MLFAPSYEERRRHLPGDALLPDAAGIVMHGITIDAPPALVWPWLVQMGSGRAGWYSYDWVDNDGHRSAKDIVPSLQTIAPGGLMPSLPGATDSFIVAAVEANRDLILTVPAKGAGLLVTWEFFLEPRAAHRNACWCAVALHLDGPGVAPATTPRLRCVLSNVFTQSWR